MYEHLRESLRETLEHWGSEVTDDDVSDLPKFRLKAVLENAESFKLYRYMPSQYFNIRNLETQTIHLSPNGIMNDVFEGLPEYFDSISYSQLQKLGDLAYMTCFTEAEDNLLMWSHYADYHKGFCIEYDLKKLNDDPFDLLHHVFPVIYTEKRQAERNLSSLANSHALLTGAIDKGEEFEEPLDDILPLFLTKGTDWEYEKEWRIVYTKKQMYNINSKTLYQGNLPFKCISAVYLGYRIHPEVKKNILEICDRLNSHNKQVAVYQAKLSPIGYSILFDKIK